MPQCAKFHIVTMHQLQLKSIKLHIWEGGCINLNVFNKLNPKCMCPTGNEGKRLWVNYPAPLAKIVDFLELIAYLETEEFPGWINSIYSNSQRDCYFCSLSIKLSIITEFAQQVANFQCQTQSDLNSIFGQGMPLFLVEVGIGQDGLKGMCLLRNPVLGKWAHVARSLSTSCGNTLRQIQQIFIAIYTPETDSGHQKSRGLVFCALSSQDLTSFLYSVIVFKESWSRVMLMAHHWSTCEQQTEKLRHSTAGLPFTQLSLSVDQCFNH